MLRELFLVVIFSQCPPLYAQSGGFAALSALTGGMGPTAPVITYGGNSSLGDGPDAISQHRLHAILPLHKDEQDSYGLSLNSSSLHLGRPPELPHDFYRVEVGGHHTRLLERGRSVTTRLMVGSASDELFVSAKDLTFMAYGAYGFPGGEASHWSLTLFISNNSPMGNYVPIPGFIYLYRTEKFMGLFGLPFASVQWFPLVPWSLSLTVFGPAIMTEVSYGPRERLQGFVGASWTPQSFIRHDREKDEDRVYLSEFKSFAGLRSPLSRNLSAELQTGYAINRVIYESSSFLKHERGSTDLDDAWFIQWNLRWAL